MAFFFIKDDDFKDTYGVPRIIQALHAHTWPNLLMKGSLFMFSNF